MPVDISNPPAHWSCAREALAELRACPGNLQSFVWSLFDDLDAMTDELLAQEHVNQKACQQQEQAALHDQIDRLASVAAELASAVAEQKHLAGQKSRPDRDKS